MEEFFPKVWKKGQLMLYVVYENEIIGVSLESH